MTHSEFPKPVKVSKDEAIEWMGLQDYEIALQGMVQTLGRNKRLMWEGIKKRYNLDNNYQYIFDGKKREIRVVRELSEETKEYLGI